MPAAIDNFIAVIVHMVIEANGTPPADQERMLKEKYAAEIAAAAERGNATGQTQRILIPPDTV